MTPASRLQPFQKNIWISAFLTTVHQLTAKPARTTERIKSLTDHSLMNSPEKVIQSSIIEMRLSHHKLTYYARKISLKIK